MLRKMWFWAGLLAVIVVILVSGAWYFFSHVNYASGIGTTETSDGYKSLSPISGNQAIDKSLDDKTKQPESSPSPESPISVKPVTTTPVQSHNYAAEDPDAKRIAQQLADQQAALLESQRQQQCELIKESYPIYVNQENSISQGNINSITSYYVGRGMAYSGAYQAAIDAEKTRHLQKLDQLESDYNAQLVQYSC